MTQVHFRKNDDHKTATMTVNGEVINQAHADIPYIKELSVDHRGVNLWTLLQDHDLKIEDLDIQADEDLQAILTGAEYMNYPYHVHDAIDQREQYNRK